MNLLFHCKFLKKMLLIQNSCPFVLVIVEINTEMLGRLIHVGHLLVLVCRWTEITWMHLWKLLFIFFGCSFRDVVHNLLAYQFGWSCKRVSFPTASLSITECCTTKSFDCHFNNSLNTWILYNISLWCSRLKNYIITK